MFKEKENWKLGGKPKEDCEKRRLDDRQKGEMKNSINKTGRKKKWRGKGVVRKRKTGNRVKKRKLESEKT